MHNTDNLILNLLNGYKIKAFPNDLISKEIIKHGIYEKNLFLFLKSILGNDKTSNCIDIGANIGVVTLTMCRYANQVISFEPTPETFKLLSSSIKENAISNCKLHNVGLSNVKQQASFFVQTSGNIGSSTLYPSNSQEYQKEISISLEVGDENSNIQAFSKLDIVKIDVEGHEPQVILGLKKTIKKHQPIIIMEWDNDSTRNGFATHKLFETILKNYSVFHLSSNSGAFRRYSKQNKYIAPFRSIARLLYQFYRSKKFLESPVLLSDFDSRECYSSIVLVPEKKMALAQLYT